MPSALIVTRPGHQPRVDAMSDKAVRQANAVVHFDISGADDIALRRFYGDLLSWQVEPKGPGYAVVRTPGGLAGSIVSDPRPKAQIKDPAVNVLTLIQK